MPCSPVHVPPRASASATRLCAELGCERQLVGVVRVDEEGDVDVAVADVPEDRGTETEPCELGLRERDRGGELADRHARVRRPLPAARGGGGHRGRDVVPGAPEPRAGVRLPLLMELQRTLLRRQRADQLEVARDAGLRALDLDEQAGADRELVAEVRVQRLDRGGVEQLESRHAEPGTHRRGRDAAGRHDRGEHHPQRRCVLGDAVEADGELGDHAERALRPDEDTREVVAGRRLRRAAAGAHDLAAR